MTTLKFSPYTIPSADIGKENPLPIFRQKPYNGNPNFIENNIPEDDRLGYGIETAWRALPYRIQDGYNRTMKSREFSSYILENEFLKVILLPEMGGIVASVFDKEHNIELLFKNPVFQPGNLAIRNAWWSGGIEWNAGQHGHHWLTCSPIHAARVSGINGEPVLRIYAWDRVKLFAYQIDLHLPSSSKQLFSRVRIINPNDYEIQMYWWTNIAVPEYENGRVIVPADTAYYFGKIVDCPFIEGTDQSYCTRVNQSYDFFFRIPKDKRPWEVSVDAQGKGIMHTSTKRLIGRKMFAWGMNPGSRHWNEFLSTPNSMPFKEIQAGLAYTQNHTIPMPANTEWTWTEAIGYFEAPTEIVHNPDWKSAYSGVEKIVDGYISEDEINKLDSKFADITNKTPDEILFRGLGWGALEKSRCITSNSKCKLPEELVFDKEDLTQDQQPWLNLLNKGYMLRVDTSQEPGQFMIQKEWQVLLEESTKSKEGNNWLTWYHLGVAYLEEDREIEAYKTFEKSIEIEKNGWAYRNLAFIENKIKKNVNVARDFYKTANALLPEIAQIAEEYIRLLIELKEYRIVKDIVESLSQVVYDQERIQMAYAQVLIELGELDKAEDIIVNKEYATIQECEVSLTEMWFRIQENRIALAENVEKDESLRKRVRLTFQPPHHIDFRMRDYQLI